MQRFTSKAVRASAPAKLPSLSPSRSRPHGLSMPVSTQRRLQSSARAKNQIYDPIRNPDSFFTHLSLSSSSRTPLLTLWTASWCSNCKAVAPLVRSLVESGVGEAEGGVGLAFVEFDSPDIMSGTPNLALTYMINSLPTLLSFDAGEAQTETKVADARKLADREFLVEWIRTEARRHGGRGGGSSGAPLFGGLFGRGK
ncbi:hypothetical protein B0I35DRAFT_484119 [Stachybotrys elegans]|uniref:Thioredoxin domain-containing protein n=1 Tax=Stachybotrys elegans TaxID=80388 RepID=A0A8K0SAN5_9HYPO|nr:hypothetical protein B0I35DRAFT_484119 [Stachybotrys elegans]